MAFPKKEIQSQKREEVISRIVHSRILANNEYEDKKQESSDEVKRYGYCHFNGIKHGPRFTYADDHHSIMYKMGYYNHEMYEKAMDNYNIQLKEHNTQLKEHNLKLKLHMIKYYQRDQTTKKFCYMLFDHGDNQEDQFKTFNVKRCIYNRIIKELGFKSFRDERVFSEENGDEIHIDVIQTIMGEVALNERLSAELEVKKAKGDPYVWIKYAFNKMGRQLGIASHKVKLMDGDKDYRKWSIRGISKSNDNDLFNNMLELAYMKYNRNRRKKEAELKKSIDTYNRWKIEKFSIFEGGCKYNCGDCERCWTGVMDEYTIKETHKEHLEKYTKMNLEGDAKLFENRSHHWDDIVEEYEEYVLEENYFWGKYYR